MNRPDLEQLQTEIEQLANEVGRLEFRVYQLESAAGLANDKAPATGAEQEADSGSGKTFDLSPVEP